MSRADVLAVSLWTWFNPKRCWQGMKSDVSPAAKVGQTQGATHPYAHTHTHVHKQSIFCSSKFFCHQKETMSYKPFPQPKQKSISLLHFVTC